MRHTTLKNTRLILARSVSLTLVLATSVAATSAAYAGDNVRDNARANNPLELVGFVQAPVQPAVSLVESGVDDGKLQLTINKTAVVTTKEKYKRFSIGQPDVADVTAVGASTLLVTGKKPGTTQIIVWNEAEQSQVVDVSVGVDVQAIREEFKKTFPEAPITVDVVNGQITLKGRVPNLKIAEQAQRVAEAYGGTGVINFLEVGGGQQIVLGVQFIEMSRAASTELGFKALFSDGGSTLGFNNGGGGNAIIGDVANNVTVFGSGNIGGTIFQAFLSALKTNSLARTLAEPNLVATSGEDAEFLAGGEIPIPVPQTGSGGASTITIEYKEFGVRLKYNAVVLGDGRIRLKVAPEVSELDYSNNTTVAGLPVPGLRTRKVSSIVEMNEGQTLALAGLLQRRVDSRASGTPGLSDLPIVGALFRGVKYERSETELVILVTPRLAQAMNPDQVPAVPGGSWRYPNELQLYGLADIGGPGTPENAEATGGKLPAPRYVGPTGFDEPEALQPTVASTDSN
jgi:pilus assembly protein CpaC